MNENFKELGILGDYIGERSKIVTYEFDSQIGYDNFPVKIIKSNGEELQMFCNWELTELISKDISIVQSLIYHVVIEQNGEVEISEIKNENSELKISDFIIEFHSMDETIEQMRIAEEENKIKLEGEKIKDKEYENKRKNTLELYASQYHNLGLNVTCISNQLNEHNFFCRNILKTPNHTWKHLFNSRQNKDEYRGYDWENATGVGSVTGYMDIRTIDLDGCSDYKFVQEILVLLGLPLDYEWVVQSGGRNGYHIYIRTEKYESLNEEQVVTSFPPLNKFNNKFDKLEILWNTHIVLPPSLHNSGGSYSFVNCRFPKHYPQVIELTNISKLIIEYLKAEKKTIGRGYGDVLFEFIPPSIPSNIDDDGNEKLKGKNVICIIDIETDGLIEKSRGNNSQSVIYPNVLQVAWILMVKDGTVYKKNSELINFPGIKFNEAFEINRLSIELIKKIGKSPNDVYRDLNNDLKIAKYIAAHNSDFDFPILKNEFDKYSIPCDMENKMIICTMKSSIEYCAIDGVYGNYKQPKLTELYHKLFNYQVTQTHNAESDALLTAKCLKELINKSIVKLND